MTTINSDIKRVAVSLIGPLLWCLLICNIQPGESFLNCFTPNMFGKMAKIGQPGLGASPHPGERAHWYPQQHQYQQQQQQQYAVMPYGYQQQQQQHPMSRLFQPKWKSSLFGPKRWMDWRMNAANMNFYRPGQGYWPPSQIPTTPVLLPTSGGGGSSISSYNPQFSEQLNMLPYNSAQILNQLSSPAAYGSSQQLPNSQLSTTTNTNSQLNDGWTVPYVTPSAYNKPSSLLPYSDNYNVVVPGNPSQPAKQQQDYGTKGASGSNKQQQQQRQQQQQQQAQNQQYGTSKNNILVANGGYNSLDAHLINPTLYTKNYSTTGLGYSYPEWYSGVVESPAKIAQQLHKIQQRRLMLGLKI